MSPVPRMPPRLLEVMALEFSPSCAPLRSAWVTGETKNPTGVGSEEEEEEMCLFV